MSNILAEWKKYNANSRNRSTGDCVTRAISLALGEDYDKIHKELCAMARKIGADAFNKIASFSRYLREVHGLERQSVKTYYSDPTPITLEEFCEKEPQGTFLILNGKKPGGTDHMACIIDGNLYDSWDISKQYVTSIWVVVKSRTQQVEVVDVSNLPEDVDRVISKFLETQTKKMPYAEFTYTSLHHKKNVDYGTSFAVVMRINTEGDIVSYDGAYTKSFVVKCNPRKSYEEQIDQLLEKARVAVREWIYSYRKDIEDLRKMRTLKVNPKYHGSRMLLTKFPEWIVPLVVSAYDNETTQWGDRYEVFTEALPGDPRGEELPEVSFYADTIPELRRNFEDYRKNFYRFNYDY